MGSRCGCRVEWVNNPSSPTVVGKPGLWTAVLCDRHSEANVKHLEAEVAIANKKIEYLANKIGLLREALGKYGKHTGDCELQNGLDKYCEKCAPEPTHYCTCGLKCTCGLDQALGGGG